MKRPATLLIDGKPYLWRDLLRMRREQLEQRRAPDQTVALCAQGRPAARAGAHRRRALRPAVAVHVAG